MPITNKFYGWNIYCKRCHTERTVIDDIEGMVRILCIVLSVGRCYDRI